MRKHRIMDASDRERWRRLVQLAQDFCCQDDETALSVRSERRYCTTRDQKENRERIEATSQKSEKEKKSIGIKKQILEAALPFVEVHGWTKTALTAGAEQLGYPGVSHGLFQREGVELVEYFYHKSNEALVTSLKALSKEYEQEITLDKPSKNVILGGVQTRLRMIIPYKDKWPEALALMTLPPNIPIALANLLTIVDDICYYAGDRSIDMSWYGRRLALAGIYKSTELYMLSDTSIDHQKSWEFLRRRVDEAIQLEAIVRSSETAGTFAKDFASATFTTARNILGLNWNR